MGVCVRGIVIERREERASLLSSREAGKMGAEKKGWFETGPVKLTGSKGVELLQHQALVLRPCHIKALGG